MPPPAIKTIKELIFYQYAKIIASSAGFTKEHKASYYKFLMDRMSKLSQGGIKMSSVLRELKMQIVSSTNACEYCSSLENLSWDHLIPKSKKGPDSAENHVLACKSCNSSKGNKGIYEWYGVTHKDEVPRIVAGKYLKLLYELHEKNGTLDFVKPRERGKLDVLDLEIFSM